MGKNKKVESRLWVRILIEFIIFFNLLFRKLFEYYYRFRAWIFKRKYVYRHHLEIYFIDNKIGFNYLDHYDYVKAKEKVIREWQEELEPEDFIYKLLVDCHRHCNYIDFKSLSNREKKLRFWVPNKNIFAFWAVDDNKIHKKNKYAVLGILNELGITKNKKNDLNIIRPGHYELSNKKYYEINFGKDKFPATQFVTTVFEEVFKEDLKYIKIELG